MELIERYRSNVSNKPYQSTNFIMQQGVTLIVYLVLPDCLRIIVIKKDFGSKNYGVVTNHSFQEMSHLPVDPCLFFLCLWTSYLTKLPFFVQIVEKPLANCVWYKIFGDNDTGKCWHQSQPQKLMIIIALLLPCLVKTPLMLRKIKTRKSHCFCTRLTRFLSVHINVN